MIAQLRNIDFSDFTIALPAFLTMVLDAVHLLDHQRGRLRGSSATWCCASRSGGRATSIR